MARFDFARRRRGDAEARKLGLVVAAKVGHGNDLLAEAAQYLAEVPFIPVFEEGDDRQQ